MKSLNVRALRIEETEELLQEDLKKLEKKLFEELLKEEKKKGK